MQDDERITLRVNHVLADALRTLGLVSPSDRALHPWHCDSVKGALCAYAHAVHRATEEVAAMFDRDEWNLMADVLNGTTTWSAGVHFPAQIIIIGNVSDGHTLNGVGAKWFGAEDDRRIEELLGKIEALQPVQADAVIAAIMHFWEYCEDIDHTQEEWWTLEHRDTGQPQRT